MPRPSVPRVTLICQMCSRPFDVYASRKDTAMFCSVSCKARVKRALVILPCQWCQKPFETHNAAAERRVYCSRECQYAARGGVKITLLCAECGTSFEVRGYREKTARFCSRACNATWKHKREMEAFWDKVQRCTHEEWCPYCCYPWKGKTENAYGMTYCNNEPIGAHRLAWELWHGRKMPAELQAAHYCHVRACASPFHIHPATQVENYADSIRDHRLRTGENHHNSRLTETLVLEAFRLKLSGLSNKAIAAQLTVSKTTITNLMAGLIWKDVPRPASLPKLKPGPQPKQIALPLS